MAVRITVYADNEIEDVSPSDLQKKLRKLGIKARGTGVRKLTDRQLQKALEKWS